MQDILKSFNLILLSPCDAAYNSVRSAVVEQETDANVRRFESQRRPLWRVDIGHILVFKQWNQ